MADVDPKEVATLIQAVDQLKTGAMFFLAFMALLAVLGFFLWLYFKYKERQATTKAAAVSAAADTEAARIEQAGKAARNKKLTDALEGLTKSFADHERWSNKQLTDVRSFIQESNVEVATALREQTDRFTKSQTSTTNQLSEALSGLKEVMQEILDRQRGAINSKDAMRIVEQTFSRIILAEFSRICEASIRHNDYATRASFIHDRVTVAMNNVIDSALKYLRTYTMTIDVNWFFPVLTKDGINYAGRPGSETGEFALVTEAWSSLKSVHECRIADKQEAVDQMNVYLNKLMSISFIGGQAKALDIYGEGGSGRHSRRNPSGEYALTPRT